MINYDRLVCLQTWRIQRLEWRSACLHIEVIILYAQLDHWNEVVTCVGTMKRNPCAVKSLQRRFLWGRCFREFFFAVPGVGEIEAPGAGCMVFYRYVMTTIWTISRARVRDLTRIRKECLSSYIDKRIKKTGNKWRITIKYFRLRNWSTTTIKKYCTAL